ncbi:pentatricopeptide repeat-containing protein [Pyrus ussuriensis x Pyrus communis]|uniref:Pentatricopeptide repeat-containing protein n=1 Tax=Pyrus ussuriensis x Pyrus communis TaxID=2448454 RepID=A0A5N5G4L2_9ROSA|nr:pentatricopeptide repeat-containing protein [Pyrus ussuriensis x Pyrus communis]
MKRRDVLANLLASCNSAKSVAQLHSQTLKVGLSQDSFFATKLNALYAKYESLGHARKVFDETPHRTVYLWNAMLRSYCREDRWEETLCLFRSMMSESRGNEEKPDNFTIPIAMKACARLRVLACGKIIHGFVKKHEKVALDMFVGSALVELYSKCGEMGEAVKAFDEFPQPDVFLWTSMVTGYEQNGDPEEALEFFSRMVMVGRINPDRVTLVSAVSACAQLSNFRIGSCVHGVSIRNGFNSNLSLGNALLNLYAKTGSVKTAARLFMKMPEKDVVSWSSMIACYTHNGDVMEALNLFNEMIDMRTEPNSVTLVSALQACALAGNLEEGKKIHEIATRKCFELDIKVATALIDMYMKCSAPEKAVDLFNRMPEKDVVSWAALLSGYAHNGMAYKSIGVFRDMLSYETKPDAVAMVKLLAACSELGILQQAFCLHAYVIKRAFKSNIYVGASLIELYSKCGSIDNAVLLFEGITDKDVVIWSAMIAGYGVHGRGEEALKVFDRMVKHTDVKPNDVTFLSILSACSHSGLVEEGIEIFNTMLHEYQLKPGPEHYGIIVDLLGRAGELDKAMEIVETMPNPIAPHVWGALLGACQIHNNTKLGEVAAKSLFRLDPNHAGYYILLSNIYAMDNKWENVTNLRTLIKEKGLKKMSGQSVVEVGSDIRSFVAGDRLHLDSDQIYGVLVKLEMKMREEGYVPNVDLLLH